MPSSTIYNQGDVVLVPYPFTNQEADKKRPALVISANWYNKVYPDIILVAVTSVIPDPPLRDQVRLSVPDITMIHSERPCIIRTGKIFTIEKTKIIKTMGHISPGTLQLTLKSLSDVFMGT
jgi:mRNA interferase MazF